MSRQTADPVDLACYNPVARGLHWLVAALAVVAVALGVAIPGAPRGTDSRDLLLSLHQSVGLAILVLMVFRIAWRLGGRPRPPPFPAGFPRLERAAAYADHALLYLLFLVMPLSGYVNAAAVGHTVSFFGLATIPPLLPQSDRASQIAVALHLTAQFAIYAAVAVHVAAALMHRVRGRHPILERMLPPPPARRRGR